MADNYFMNPRGTAAYDRDAESRILRDRQRKAEDQIDKTRPKKGGTPTFAGQVYNGGSMGSTTPLWYLTHPVEFSGNECESCSYSPTADTSKSIPVIVLGGVPSAGDILLAEMIGGKWVAEEGGCSVKFTVLCVSTPVSGATVTVKNGGTTVASGTTNGSGVVTLNIPSAGTYTVVVPAVGSCTAGYSGSLALSCGGSYTLPCCVAVNCGNCTWPTTLFVTDSSQTTACPSTGFLVWQGAYRLTTISGFDPCTCAGQTGGSGLKCSLISYNISCIGPNTFHIERTWSFCDNSSGSLSNCGFCCPPVTLPLCSGGFHLSCSGFGVDQVDFTFSSCNPFPLSPTLALFVRHCSSGIGTITSPLPGGVTINS